MKTSVIRGERAPRPAHRAGPALFPPPAAYSLAADVGSFAESGRAAAFVHGYGLAVSAGSFALTGVAASFLVGRRLAASAGAFGLSGVAASLYGVTSPTTATLTGPTSGALGVASTTFTVTLDQPAGIGGVYVTPSSTGPVDTFA